MSATLEVPPVLEKGKALLQNVNWKKVGKLAAGAVISVASGVALGHFVGNKRK